MLFKSVMDRLRGGKGGKAEGSGPQPADLYQDHVAGLSGVFTIPGLRPEEAQQVLQQPLIDLRLISGVQGVKLQGNAAREVSGARQIWDFLRAEVLATARVFAVVGGQGSGRTVLLQHMALTLAQRRHARYDAPSMLPIFLPVREHLAALSSDPSPDLDAFLQQGPFLPQQLPAGWFLQQLKQQGVGAVLVFLDGLDEIDDPPQLQAISRWLNRQIEAFPGCRFMVSLRPHGFREVRIDHACAVEVQPLRGEQVKRFLDVWFLARSGQGAKEGKDREEALQAAGRSSQALLNHLRPMPSVAALTNSPMLLAAMARLYEARGGQLPEQRVLLLNALCQELAQPPTVPASQSLDMAGRLKAMRALADHISRGRGRDFKADDVRKVAGSTIGAGGADELLREARLGRGLLQESELGRLRFAHPLLQEVLLAAHMTERPPSERRLDQLVQDPFWHESLSLFAAQSDATPLVRACLQAQSVQTLCLASECLDVGRGLDRQVRAAAEKVLVEPLGGPAGKARKLATEVRLLRRMKSLRRMDETREIDPNYITCAEYQLFMDEMRERGHYEQPDHWPAMSFHKGQQDMPVAGVRPEDARDFCVWLNMRTGAARYRLPRPEEVRGFPADSDRISAWCKEGEVYSLVGLGRQREQAIVAQLGRMQLLSMPATLPMERALHHSMDVLFDKAIIKLLELQTDAIAEQGLIHALSHVRELLIVRALELGTVISPDLDLARGLARASRHPEVSTAIERFEIGRARKLLEELMNDFGEFSPEGRLSRILGLILDAVESTTVSTVQQAQRRYFALMAEWVHESYAGEDLTSGQRRHKQLQVAEFHGWLQIVLKRAEGELPAWEGIRLVRDMGLSNSTAETLDLPTWAYNA